MNVYFSAIHFSQNIGSAATILGLALLQTSMFTTQTFAQENISYQASDLETTEAASLPRENDGDRVLGAQDIGGSLDDTEPQSLFPDSFGTNGLGSSNSQFPVWSGFPIGGYEASVCELEQASLCFYVPLN